jgi:hypothetical protein
MIKHPATTAALCLMLAGVAVAAAAPQHTRLFRPEDLGQLEPPDRDEWQRTD